MTRPRGVRPAGGGGGGGAPLAPLAPPFPRRSRRLSRAPLRRAGLLRAILARRRIPSPQRSRPDRSSSSATTFLDLLRRLPPGCRQGGLRRVRRDRRLAHPRARPRPHPLDADLRRDLRIVSWRRYPHRVADSRSRRSRARLWLNRYSATGAEACTRISAARRLLALVLDAATAVIAAFSVLRTWPVPPQCGQRMKLVSASDGRSRCRLISSSPKWLIWPTCMRARSFFSASLIRRSTIALCCFSPCR